LLWNVVSSRLSCHRVCRPSINGLNFFVLVVWLRNGQGCTPIDILSVAAFAVRPIHFVFIAARESICSTLLLRGALSTRVIEGGATMTLRACFVARRIEFGAATLIRRRASVAQMWLRMGLVCGLENR